MIEAGFGCDSDQDEFPSKLSRRRRGVIRGLDSASRTFGADLMRFCSMLLMIYISASAFLLLIFIDGAI